MNTKEFKNFINQQYDNDEAILSLIKQDTSNEVIFNDCKPGQIQLDKIVTISQQLQDNTIKSFDFNVVQIWLKPNNMFTIVNVKKEKEQKNFWILFYMDGCYYLKKGIKGPIGVHCQLKETPEQQEK